MLTHAPLKLSAVPAGLGLGACLWLVLGGANPPVEIGQLQDRLTAAERLMRPRSSTQIGLGAVAQGRPLFTLATSGTSGEPGLVLQGLSLGAGDKGALIAIGGAPPIWLGFGESRSGVTLRRVDGSSALVETLSGDHSLTLGGSAASGSPPPRPTGAVGVAPPPPPAGVR